MAHRPAGDRMMLQSAVEKRGHRGDHSCLTRHDDGYSLRRIFYLHNIKCWQLKLTTLTTHVICFPAFSSP